MRRRAGMVVASVMILGAAASALCDMTVYTDALAAGWANWSWSTTANFANTSPVRGSSGTAISVRFTSAWAGLYLHADSQLTAASYASLRFSIHGGASGGQGIRVALYDADLNEAGTITLTPLLANTWTDVVLPISSFATTTIGGVVWQDTQGQAQPTFYLDDIAFVAGPPPPSPSLSVDAGASRHAISPYIYGMNFADPGLAAELRLPVNRWGGNATTRYNWQNDTSNRAMDWYFENLPNSNAHPAALPDGSSSDQFVDANRATGTDSIITVPLIGWTPKARAIACGFSVAKYGPQQSTDPWRPDCGNGIKLDASPVTNNDPHDTSVEIDPGFVQEWIAHLQSRYGSAAAGGVQFYNLDNEPMLWNSTHRDVHPAGTGYDELRDRTLDHAAAIKATDPAAMTLGPVLWGWTAYFYSAADQASGGAWWNTRPDRMAHGDVPFVEWYLQQMQSYHATHGTRILDYLDLHYYPQASGVALSGAGDAATQMRRLRSTRSLWDPGYVDESWIGEAVRLIPRMREWVAANYPGTKLAITEYNWGGMESINGAVAQADVLGIFGREQLDLATIWDPPTISQPGAFAFRMYRNYDGAGGQFGTTSVRAASTDQGQAAVYAALRVDGRLTLMLINKTNSELSCPLTLAGFWPSPTGQLYRYSAADLTHIVHAADVPAGRSMSVDLPGSSISLLVLSPDGPPADQDRDGDVDADDFQSLLDCGSGPAIAHGPSCADADLDRDADVDDVDFAIFQRCLSGLGVPANPNCR